MSLDDFATVLANLHPGQEARIRYHVYAALFPPGEPDEGSRERCYNFAKEHGCLIHNRLEEQAVDFLKPKWATP